jgi:hypothetical protein
MKTAVEKKPQAEKTEGKPAPKGNAKPAEKPKGEEKNPEKPKGEEMEKK